MKYLLLLLLSSCYFDYDEALNNCADTLKYINFYERAKSLGIETNTYAKAEVVVKAYMHNCVFDQYVEYIKERE